MAIDTRDKRANVMRINTLFLFMGLSPTSGMDTDDRENSGRGYIGLTYDEAPEIASVRGRLRVGVGVGLGF